MTRPSKLFHSLRVVSEISFLCLFGFLLYRGQVEKWLLVFGFGVIASVFFGRFYCGWICPMHTLFRPVDRLYRKLGIRRLHIPPFFAKPWIRYILLVLFVPTMLITKRMELKVPHLALVTAVAVVITLVFEEAFWHNRLCPYGTILGFTSRKTKKRVAIVGDLCVSCGKCQTVCPAHAIDTTDSKKRTIRKADCLVCHACEQVCPTNAIGYR